MAMVIITGYVVATTRPVYRLIRALAGIPRTARGAIAMVALFAMLSSWFNWGFSLIFSAMLAKETARRLENVDYRALAASEFLGLGSVWAQGLSGSAALQMATPGMLQPEIRTIVAAGNAVPGGMIPLTHTIFLWQSLVSVLVEVVVVTLVVYAAAPWAGTHGARGPWESTSLHPLSRARSGTTQHPGRLARARTVALARLRGAVVHVPRAVFPGGPTDSTR